MNVGPSGGASGFTVDPAALAAAADRFRQAAAAVPGALAGFLSEPAGYDTASQQGLDEAGLQAIQALAGISALLSGVASALDAVRLGYVVSDGDAAKTLSFAQDYLAGTLSPSELAGLVNADPVARVLGAGLVAPDQQPPPAKPLLPIP